MGKAFKKNQRVIATLPTGRVVEGIYIEPYGSEGHSFYVNEFDGTDRDGQPKYKKARYGVTDEYIEAAGASEKSVPTESQYRAWLKRAVDLESKIKELENDKSEKNLKKIDRYNDKLEKISTKIKEYEDSLPY